MKNDISKSPELLQKEERIIFLTNQLKKKKSSLRGLKTKLNKLKEKVDKVQKDIFREEVQNGERAETLNKDIKKLLLEIKKWKELSQDDLYIINDFLEQCNTFEEYHEEQEQDFADFLDSEEFERMHKERVADVFEQFQEQPTKEEKRNIRKIFIGLSNRFHPDKAQNEKDRKTYHNIQQQVNEAYKVNDIERLLELEHLYFEDSETKIEQNTDGLDSLIGKLERDLDFISQQAKRTSKEIKEIRNSDLGNMVTDVSRLEKEGKGVSALFKEMHAGLEALEHLYKALQKCKKDRSIEPLYEEMERIDDMMFDDIGYDELDAELDKLSETEQMDLLSLMTGEFYDDDDDDDFEPAIPVKNPKFPIGSSVKIKNDLYIDDYIPWNLYGSQGRVLSAYKTGATIMYEITLDSISLKSIPEEIKDGLFEDYVYFFVQEVSTSNLKKAKPRDSEAQALSERRKMFHTRFWSFMDEEDGAMMQNILLTKPAKKDDDNWKLYLNEYFDFPFMATTCTALNIQPNKKVEVLKIVDFSGDEGHIVQVKYKNEKLLYPIMSLRTGVKKMDKLLKLYRIWFNELISKD